MEEIGATFIFTGEVLGQRPMSQNRRAMGIIERESGLEGRVLRPLSARLMEPTIPEIEGAVDRDRLLALQGRSRKPQMAMVGDRGITDYPCPAGGCRLTDPGFARRMRDLVLHHPGFDLKDVKLLKVGRHFRISPQAKAVAGRNERENQAILAWARDGDTLFEVPVAGSPVTLLRGGATREDIAVAATITARYSDADGDEIEVHYGRRHGDLEESISVSPLGEDRLARLRL
jgi:hypothetical protein